MEETIVQGWWVQGASVIMALAIGGMWLLVRKYIGVLLTKIGADEAQQKAIEALLEGMAEQQPFANGIKKAAADGKITKEEAKNLEQAAWNIAKEAATGPAKDIVMAWTTRKVSSLVKQLLSKHKSK